MNYRRIAARIACAATLGCIIVGLGGCGTSAPVLKAEPSGSVAIPEISKQHWKMVALAPLFGAPVSIQDRMLKQVTDDALREGVVIRGDAGAKVDFTLRGYLLVTPNQSAYKVTYVWDVVDQHGVRVNRVAGEEIVASTTNTRDRWDTVTPAVVAMIADKGVKCLAASVAGATAGTGASALGAAPRD